MATAVPPTDLNVVARTLLLDRVAAVATEKLRSQGIDSILLKGAAIASWLYQGEVRPYVDVDLLVSPVQFEKASQILAELGYVHWLEGADAAELGPKERELIGPDGVCIDLHLGFVGIPGPALRCWDILAQHTAPFTLAGGTEVQVLDLPARSLHLALHAAQNGPIDVKAIADLQRGLAQVDQGVWRAAASLAEDLGATETFAAGLRLVPAGRRLADQLSLPHRTTVELMLRTRSAPQQAIFFERLRQTPGARRRATLVARKLFPTATYLRSQVPTSRGPLGLLSAWAGHAWSLARGTAPAVIAWIRARSATRDAEDKT